MFELLLDFFSEITSLQRGGLLAVGLMFFCIIEGCRNTFGNIKFKYSCKKL